MNHYNQNFYKTNQGAIISAKEIVPVIINTLNPKSVIDLGCGAGSWLSVFMEQGIDDILGIDGNWLNIESLMIPINKFANFNLENRYSSERNYDLALCLEVAEHLHSDKAVLLVDVLTSLSSVVLFSAAIPHQGGIHHYNEQWLDYWIKLFHDRNYVPIDFIRPLIWNNKNIRIHYKQNLMLFCKEDDIAAYPNLADAYKCTNPNYLSFVHPLRYLEKCENMAFKDIFLLIVNKISHFLHITSLDT